MVSSSRNEANPPCGGVFFRTPVVWEYWPLRMLARLGQHSGFTTKLLVKVIPWPTSSDCTSGIASSVSHRWSSDRISTMLGLPWTFGRARAEGDGRLDEGVIEPRAVAFGVVDGPPPSRIAPAPTARPATSTAPITAAARPPGLRPPP